MAIAVVQRTFGNDPSSTGTSTATFGSTTTLGNAIIALIGVNNNTTNSGAPSDGHNTYTLAANMYQSSMNVGFKAYIAYNIAATSSLAVSSSDNFNNQTIFIYEVSGLASANAYDTYASQQITGTSAASPGITTNNASELLLGFFGTEDGSAFTYTVGTGFSNIQASAVANWSTAVEEQVISSQGSYSSSAGGPSGQISQCGIVAFSATAITTTHNYANPGMGIPSGMDNRGYTRLRPHAFSPGLPR